MKKLTENAQELLHRIEEKLGPIWDNQEPETFICHRCEDLGRILRTDDRGQRWARPCPHCEKGQLVVTGAKLDKFKRTAEEADRRMRVQYRHEAIEESAKAKADDDLPF